MAIAPCFPIPLGEAALFDPGLWEASAREAAKEAAADGIHLTFAPMLDVTRDPRWGRIAEGPGEDAFVAQQMARAKVAGFQGANLANAASLAACAKHYCAYGAVTAGRDYASTEFSDRSLSEIYLPPFQAAVAAGVATIMPAFTDVAGVPMSAHRALLTDYLRGALGFKGVVISDYNAIAELIHHGVAADLAEAAALALKAGVDMDMMSNAYRAGLPVALNRDLVTMADIDAAVARVLTLKEQLGLFDDPYGRGGPESATSLAGRRQLAREIASGSVVLLKNDKNALPLAEGRLALIGPLADAPGEMRGCWSAAGTAADCVSVLAGLRFALPHQSIRYAEGVDIESEDESRIAAALALCDDADTIVLCLGEAANMSGEACSRAHPGIARQAGRAGGGGNGARQWQEGNRHPVFGQTAGGAGFGGARGCVAGGLGARQRGRQCPGRYSHRPRRALRPHARELAARGGTDSRLFRRAPDRPPRQSGGSLHQQISRRGQCAAFSLRPRPRLRRHWLFRPFGRARCGTGRAKASPSP